MRDNVTRKAGIIWLGGYHTSPIALNNISSKLRSPVRQYCNIRRSVIYCVNINKARFV